MDLDLRDLELLDVLADSVTLTAAADRLFVSQPALSQRLTKMEDRLGVRLFDREGRRLVATRAGRRMLVTARHVLAELRAAEREIRELDDQRVRFTSQCNTALAWLPTVIRRFRAQHPNAEVRIESVPGDLPVAALLDDRVDVALVVKPDPQMDRVELTRLFDDEMVAVVAGDHPWAGRKYLAGRDFAGAHVILYDVYDQTRVPTPAMPLPHGARPGRITIVPVIADLVIEMVAGGEGVTILPRWVAQPYARSHGVQFVQLGVHPMARTWYSATRRGPQPAHITAFARELTLVLPHPDDGGSGAQPRGNLKALPS